MKFMPQSVASRLLTFGRRPPMTSIVVPVSVHTIAAISRCCDIMYSFGTEIVDLYYSGDETAKYCVEYGLPKPPFIRQSGCKRRPDNSCPCNGVEPTPPDIPPYDIPPYDIPRPGPARANACVGLRAQFPRKGLSCRLGHDVAAADIDAGGREGAVRLLGGCGGRDGGAGF